jgi:hypothetical protein
MFQNNTLSSKLREENQDIPNKRIGGYIMADYLSIANHPLVFAVCGFVLFLVLVQSVISLVIAWKRGVSIGMDRSRMKAVIRSSAIFSIVPSLPIVLSLMAIAPVLGLPFSWLRLSVIGSAPYELIAAGIGAKSMGIADLGAPGYTAQVFGNSMWIMTLGIMTGLVLCIFTLRRYQRKMIDMGKKDSKWPAIMVNALFFGMLSVFIGPPAVQGGSKLYVMFFSAAVMLAITYVAKRMKSRSLEEFAMAFSMLCGMVFAVVLSRVGG